MIFIFLTNKTKQLKQKNHLEESDLAIMNPKCRI